MSSHGGRDGEADSFPQNLQQGRDFLASLLNAVILGFQFSIRNLDDTTIQTIAAPMFRSLLAS